MALNLRKAKKTSVNDINEKWSPLSKIANLCFLKNVKHGCVIVSLSVSAKITASKLGVLTKKFPSLHRKEPSP